MLAAVQVCLQSKGRAEVAPVEVFEIPGADDVDDLLDQDQSLGDGSMAPLNAASPASVQ